MRSLERSLLSTILAPPSAIQNRTVLCQIYLPTMVSSIAFYTYQLKFNTMLSNIEHNLFIGSVMISIVGGFWSERLAWNTTFFKDSCSFLAFSERRFWTIQFFLFRQVARCITTFFKDSCSFLAFSERRFEQFNSCFSDKLLDVSLLTFLPLTLIDTV
jgi:hypothetical protein